MSRLSFRFDDLLSIYINTRLSNGRVVLTPLSSAEESLSDWDTEGTVTVDDHEVGHINNGDSSDRYFNDTLTINQSAVGNILFRALVKAVDVPDEEDNDYSLFSTLRHTDGTNESAYDYDNLKKLLPPGKYKWTQFSVTASSNAGKTIQYFYPYLRLRNRIGEAYFKWAEVIDLSNATLADRGEAWSRPECIYEPATPTGPQGTLKLSKFAFPYGKLDKLLDVRSVSRTITELLTFDYIVVDKPGDLTTRENYVIDQIKASVNVFGYTYMGEGRGLADIKADIDDIAGDGGWYGVFVDQFGYDWDETRARQNEIVDYIHAAGLIAFVNGWNIDDVLGDTVDVTDNPDGTSTTLAATDWVLLESFMITNAGGGTDDYYDETDMLWQVDRALKTITYKETLDINVCCLSYMRDATADNPYAKANIDDAKLSYMMALMCGFEGWYFVHENAETEFNYIPDINLNLGESLSTAFYQILPWWYIAETDKYLIIFNTEAYPPMTYQVFDKSINRALPHGVDMLYSDDMDEWADYDPDVGTTGKFMREKRVITP